MNRLIMNGLVFLVLGIAAFIDDRQILFVGCIIVAHVLGTGAIVICEIKKELKRD